MKFKLTKNTKNHFGTTLFQIEATADFGSVAKGELGGWVEKESNLNQEGNAWVSGDAWVSGNARVSGNAWVSGNAQVSGFHLKAGFFFGMRYDNEEIKYLKDEDGDEIIYKGDAIINEDDEVEDTKKQELLNKADELVKKAKEPQEGTMKLNSHDLTLLDKYNQFLLEHGYNDSR